MKRNTGKKLNMKKILAGLLLLNCFTAFSQSSFEERVNKVNPNEVVDFTSPEFEGAHVMGKIIQKKRDKMSSKVDVNSIESQEMGKRWCEYLGYSGLFSIKTKSIASLPGMSGDSAISAAAVFVMQKQYIRGEIENLYRVESGSVKLASVNEDGVFSVKEYYDKSDERLGWIERFNYFYITNLKCLK